jgi:hypothetical protein
MGLWCPCFSLPYVLIASWSTLGCSEFRPILCQMVTILAVCFNCFVTLVLQMLSWNDSLLMGGLVDTKININGRSYFVLETQIHG